MALSGYHSMSSRDLKINEDSIPGTGVPGYIGMPHY
jgi:hypothetical protein